ncbi:MAG: trigger factor [Clostridia bacterium]
MKPEVTLGDYKGLEVEKNPVIVTEDDVDAEIKKTAERNSRMLEVDDRPAAMDDTVTIDFEALCGRRGLRRRKRREP